MKVKIPNAFTLGIFGAANQSRTGDLILTKDALYLLSHSSILCDFDIILYLIIKVKENFIILTNKINFYIIYIIQVFERGNLVKSAIENHSKCCFTGYRPEKFPFELNENSAKFVKFENDMFEQILKLAEENCTTFYCGMAMGFDLLAGEAVLSVKNVFANPLKLVCVLPFKGQGKGFPTYWKEKFQKVIEKCDEIIVLSEKYHMGCYQERNIYMVDNSDYVITWFDGQKGGTQNTLRYAKKRGRQIFNVRENSANLAIQTEFKII